MLAVIRIMSMSAVLSLAFGDSDRVAPTAPFGALCATEKRVGLCISTFSCNNCNGLNENAYARDSCAKRGYPMGRIKGTNPVCDDAGNNHNLCCELPTCQSQDNPPKTGVCVQPDLLNQDVGIFRSAQDIPSSKEELCQKHGFPTSSTVSGCKESEICCLME